MENNVYGPLVDFTDVVPPARPPVQRQPMSTSLLDLPVEAFQGQSSVFSEEDAEDHKPAPSAPPAPAPSASTSSYGYLTLHLTGEGTSSLSASSQANLAASHESLLDPEVMPSQDYFRGLWNSRYTPEQFKTDFIAPAQQMLESMNSDPDLLPENRNQHRDCVIVGTLIAYMASLPNLIGPSLFKTLFREYGVTSTYPLNLDGLRKSCPRALNIQDFILTLGKKALISHDIPFGLEMFTEDGVLYQMLLESIGEKALEGYRGVLNTHLDKGLPNRFVNGCFRFLNSDSRLDYTLSREGQYDHRAAQQRFTAREMEQEWQDREKLLSFG